MNETNIPLRVSATKNSYLHKPEIVAMLFAILVKRCGGEIVITQTDIDDIAFNRLDETYDATDCTLKFKLIKRMTAA